MVVAKVNGFRHFSKVPISFVKVPDMVTFSRRKPGYEHRSGEPLGKTGGMSLQNMFCLKWNSQKCCFQFSWDWRNSTKTEKEINLQIYDIKLSDWIMTSQSTRRNVRPSASNETLTNAAFTRTSSLLVSSTSETWSCKWEKWSSFSVQWSSYLLVVHVSIA